MSRQITQEAQGDGSGLPALVAARLPWWQRCVVTPRMAVDHVSRLFRFRPFHEADLDPSQLGYLANLLATGTLFVPTARTFNDPWEVAPNFEPVGWKTDRHREIAEFLAFLTPDLNTPEHRAGVAEEIRRLTPEVVLRMGQHVLRERLLGTPILCLNDRPDNFLMWSYYAKGHNGYALGFDARYLPFASAVQVKYSRRHPRIFLNCRDMTGVSVQVLATKARQWKHEGEWRVIAPSGNAERLGLHNMRPYLDQGYYAEIARECLRSVIIGDQLYNSRHGPDVIKLLRQTPGVQVLLAEIDRRAFKIGLRRL